MKMSHVNNNLVSQNFEDMDIKYIHQERNNTNNNSAKFIKLLTEYEKIYEKKCRLCNNRITDQLGFLQIRGNYTHLLCHLINQNTKNNSNGKEDLKNYSTALIKNRYYHLGNISKIYSNSHLIFGDFSCQMHNFKMRSISMYKYKKYILLKAEIKFYDHEETIETKISNPADIHKKYASHNLEILDRILELVTRDNDTELKRGSQDNLISAESNQASSINNSNKRIKNNINIIRLVLAHNSAFDDVSKKVFYIIHSNINNTDEVITKN